MTQEERLATFEQMLADLCAQQAQTIEQLETLRAAGKEKTVRFRELLGQKLMLAQQIAIYERYGLL